MTLRFVALGGLGEVGTNCAVFELEGQLLVVDCGVSFPDDDAFGIDQVHPDLRALIERAEDIAGVIVTHAHQDHIGALPALLDELDVPVYLPAFAEAMLRTQLRQTDLRDEDVETHVVRAGERVQIGPFDVEFVHVTHSIPQTLALALHTPIGVVVHTADFKIDEAPPNEPPIDAARFRALGDGRVRALFSDSTNVERPGRTTSESLVREGLRRAVDTADGRVLVTLFSTNVARMQALVDAADSTGRRLLLLGRSLQRNFMIARDLGLIRMSRETIIDEDAGRDAPASSLVVALTGSQAQQRTALARMAFEQLAGYRIQPGDRVVFSARAIPGNESAIARLKDQIVRRGGHIYDAPDIHCSGHAMRDEQAEMLAWVRPETFVPVHGDHRFLVAHARLAGEGGCRDAHVLENGQVLELTERGSRVVGEWKTGKICVDGTPFGEEHGEALQGRRRLARGGLVVLTLVVDRDTGALTRSVDAREVGVADPRFLGDLLARVAAAAESAVAQLAPRAVRDEERLSEAVRVAALRAIKSETGRRAYVFPVVVYA
ncbi:MAG: ribonuclease J [Myxococcales bacterium]|nr:ribonuclease J [Myxococcales bacterium]